MNEKMPSIKKITDQSLSWLLFLKLPEDLSKTNIYQKVKKCKKVIYLFTHVAVNIFVSK